MDIANLGDRLAMQANPFCRCAQRQFTGKTHLLIKGHIRRLAAAHPCNLDAAAVGCRHVTPRLRGIKIGTVVCTMCLVFSRKSCAIKIADVILPCRAPENPPGILQLAVNGEFKDVRAFRIRNL